MRWSLLGVFLCVAIQGSAEVRIKPALLEWPLMPNAATLSVQGPDGQVRILSFSPGQTPRLRLTDLGEGAIDGSYSWELRVVAQSRAERERHVKLRADAEERDVEPLVQAGSFVIANGSFLTPRAVEAAAVRPGNPASNDQLIPDDLIVQGSLCVGLSCVNPESFSFNTILLKENNVRIAVEDTSSYPYPDTDWTIAFNDSASGGASQLTITDSSARTTPFGIEGAARSRSFWIDATGRIGLGTWLPAEDLHLLKSDTPTLRLEQDETGGFTAQTWDIGGNEAMFFIRDITAGSRMPLRIRPGAPTSSIEVRADGNVGLNCGTATSDLVIASGSGCANPSSSINAGDAQFTVASSRTFKENLAPVLVPDVLEKLSKIDVYRYDFIDGPKDRLGLIAEDFHEIFARGSEKYIDGNEVQMALWLAVKQLLARIETLEAKLAQE